jgi:hypothetical protein
VVAQDGDQLRRSRSQASSSWWNVASVNTSRYKGSVLIGS